MVPQKLLSLVLSGDQVDHTDIWAPLLKLILPIRDYSFRDHNHEVAFDFFELPKEGQKRDRLDGFTQTLNIIHKNSKG